MTPGTRASQSWRKAAREMRPVLRGWGHYYKRAHVRTLFNKLDRWIERRIWSHRYKCWRNCGWKQLPARKLYGEYGLVQFFRNASPVPPPRPLSSRISRQSPLRLRDPVSVAKPLEAGDGERIAILARPPVNPGLRLRRKSAS